LKQFVRLTDIAQKKAVRTIRGEITPTSRLFANFCYDDRFYALNKGNTPAPRGNISAAEPFRLPQR